MKNKEKILEIFRYLIVGVLTTFVSLGVYYALVKTILNPEDAFLLQVANVISWIVSVLFAYVTNRVFVFKSKNKNKWKEISSFVGSRVVTLFMDMLIMFLGVTIFSINDKFVKLFSQVLVIVANYIFSKVFVFRSKERKKKDFSKFYSFVLKALLLLIPFLQFFQLLFENEMMMWISFSYFWLLFFVFVLSLFVWKKHRAFLAFLMGYLLIQHLYFYCHEYPIFLESYALIQIFLLPVSVLFFQECSLFNGKSTFSKIFFLSFISFLFLYFKVDFSGSFSLFLPLFGVFFPFIIKQLWYHHNYVVISFGFLMIFILVFFLKSFFLSLIVLFTLVSFILKDRKEIKKEILLSSAVLIMGIFLFGYTAILKYQEIQAGHTISQVFLDSRVDDVKNMLDIFQKENMEKQIFGIVSVEKTSVDFADIFSRVGVLGFVIYFCSVLYFLFHTRFSFLQGLSFLGVFCSSIFIGDFLVNGFSVLLLGFSGMKKQEEKRKILLVSNMYPSKKYKHYGSFVKNTKESLENIGFQVDKVVKTKQVTFLGKFVGYSLMYLKGIYKSIFYSYDYIYVHFISQSTFCVLLGRITSRNTILVLNVHGNDIVPDSKEDEVNVKRSQFVLKYADKVVSPSVYFKEVLQDTYHVASEKIVIYPSGGIDFEIFKTKDQSICRKELGLEESCFYIGYVGRIETNKGWDTLLEAFQKLKKQKSFRNTKLLVIGTGSEQNVFDLIVKKYKLEDFVIQKDFAFQEDLVNYYNAMDVFVFPTKRKSESLGLVGLEAMACKTFVIGCDLYGPREYLKNRENSLTYGEDKTGELLFKKILEYQKLSEKEKTKMIDSAYQEALKYDKRNQEKLLRIIFS